MTVSYLSDNFTVLHIQRLIYIPDLYVTLSVKMDLRNQCLKSNRLLSSFIKCFTKSNITANGAYTPNAIEATKESDLDVKSMEGDLRHKNGFLPDSRD